MTKSKVGTKRKSLEFTKKNLRFFTRNELKSKWRRFR